MEEKLVLFLDYANINRAAGERRCPLDYADLLQYVSEGRFLVEAHSYVPINPRCEHRGDRDIEVLWQAGYLVHTRLGTLAGGTYRCNFDVEIATDMLKALYQVKPDIMVLASGDADFVPLIQEVRQAGVRVEVAAFPETAGAEMRLKCSGFIDLAVYAESHLAVQRSQQEQRTEERYRDLIRSQQGELQKDVTTAHDRERIRLQQREQEKRLTEQDKALIHLPQGEQEKRRTELSQALALSPQEPEKASAGAGQGQPELRELAEDEEAYLAEQMTHLLSESPDPGTLTPDLIDDLDL